MSSDLKISDICQKIYSGGTPSTLNRSFYEGGTIPWLKTKEVDFKKIYSTETKITEFGLNNSSAKLVPVNSVIIAMYGETAGKVAINKIPLTTNQACCNLIVNPSKANFRFVYFYLLSIYKELLGMRVGGAQQNLSATLIKEIPFPKISLLKQNKIAEFLGNIEDLIEAAQHKNTALEAIAQRLFRSWFVNFDPVHAKATCKEPDAISAELAALFPSEFENSELGPIPKGWLVSPYADTVEILSGGTPKTSVAEYWNGDIPWFSVTDAPVAGQVFVLRTEKHITKAGLENSPAKLLPSRSTIISARGTVGKIGMVSGQITINQSCYALSPKNDQGVYWVYFQTRNLVSALKQMAHGGVFDTITRETFKGVKVVIPPKTIFDAFSSASKPLFDAIECNGRLVLCLTELRDHLLPRLISGKLNLEEAEQAVKEATVA